MDYMFKYFVNPDRPDSFSNKMRRRRFALFLSFVERLGKKKLSILDVGGTSKFWETMNFGVSGEHLDNVRVTLLNLEKYEVKHPNFTSVVGDARNMTEFGDNEFDIVFSNSVIEHVGELEDQKKMASEVRRVGKNYYIQTPNYYFVVEPHFLFPGFQWLPFSWRTALIRRFDLGTVKRIPDPKSALEYIRSIRLLKRGEMKELFPESVVHSEKFFGMTKSFVSIKY